MAGGKVTRVALVMLCLVFAAGCLASSSVGLSRDDLLADCATETYAASDQPTKIKFVVWCGVRKDDVSFSLRRPKDESIEDFKHELKAWGRGAVAPFRCSRRDEAVRCVGRKEGPMKVQGWITVEDERCTVGLHVALDGADVGKPTGCPGTQPLGLRWNLRYLQSERRQFGFDADLEGDQAAIARRIRGLIRAWRRGEPVARGTAAFLGMPMRAREQREWEYRFEYVPQSGEALRRWVAQFAEDAYAGYYVDHEDGGTIYIGFVGDQERQLAEFIASGGPIAPERLKPFPLPPKYSLVELGSLQSELMLMVRSLGEAGFENKINRIGVNVESNVVEVGTQHVEEVRALIDERFGPDAPIVVVYGRLRPRPGVVKPKKTSGFRMRWQDPCAGATEIDYEAPLAELPPLPRNSARDGLGIGPPRLRLAGAGATLNVGAGRFGYRLWVDRRVIRRPVFLDGYTELELDRVDRAGRVVEAVVAKRQRLGVVASPAFNGKSFLVSVPAKPGLYRFQARLRDAQGRAVGRYADYLRVVRPVTDVRLVTSGGPIGPGSRVDFWIENRGTGEVDPMGVAFAFEVFEGGSWSKAPGSPEIFPKVGLKPLSAGEAGACNSFQIPPDAIPGLYRFSKRVTLSSGAKTRLTSEFRVSSP